MQSARENTMPLWLYDLPNWQFGALVTLAWVAIGLIGHELTHRFVRPRFDESDKALALALMGVVATMNSLLLAFSAVSVWDAFRGAERAVSSEASTLSQLALDLAVFDSAEARTARQTLRVYAQEAVASEWPAMRQQQLSPSTWQRFDGFFAAVGQLQPATPRQTALMPEIWARVNETVKLRRERLEASQARVPSTLWTVILVGTLLSLASTYVVPRTPFNRAAIAMLSLSIGLVFFFVADVDRPFSGTESIGPEPFEHSLANMARWDTGAAH
jgi:hypothetical protein